MEGNNHIEYGPAEKINKIDKTKTSLIESIESFSLQELLAMQKKIGIIIAGSEEAPDEEKERIIKEGLIGHINTAGKDDNWLESLETKIKIILADRI